MSGHTAMDASAIHAQLGASGWLVVLAQVIDQRYLQNRHGPCPACGGKDRFRFDNKNGHGDFFCNGCGAGDGFQLVMKVAGLSFADARKRVMDLAGLRDDEHDQSAPREQAPPHGTASVLPFPPPPQPPAPFSDFARSLWFSTKPLGGIALDYLRARGVVIPPKGSDLRWHPSLHHPVDDFVGPALVALIRNAITGKPQSLHRTWINSDGTKRGAPPRLFLKGHQKAGGVVMLWPSETVTHGLGVAEGIETALAAAHIMQPTWALIDAGNMAQFPVLPGIEALTIFADNDAAGLHGAEAAAARWRAEDREVRVLTPRTEGRDIADLAAA